MMMTMIIMMAMMMMMMTMMMAMMAKEPLGMHARWTRRLKKIGPGLRTLWWKVAKGES